MRTSVFFKIRARDNKNYGAGGRDFWYWLDWNWEWGWCFSESEMIKRYTRYNVLRCAMISLRCTFDWYEKAIGRRRRFLRTLRWWCDYFWSILQWFCVKKALRCYLRRKGREFFSISHSPHLAKLDEWFWAVRKIRWFDAYIKPVCVNLMLYYGKS